MDDKSAARTQSNGKSFARLAPQRVDGKPGHLVANGLEESRDVGGVAQDQCTAQLHQKVSCALEARVVRDEVDRADLEHLAQLDHRLPSGQVGAVLQDGVARLDGAVVLEDAVGRAQGARAREVLQRQQLRGNFEQPRRVADAQRAPAADRRHARVGQRDHPVLHFQRARRELRHVLGGGEHDADALHSGDGGQRQLLPLVVRPVEGREVIQD
mmetsp:Transcript_34954/g.86989  ORF Transcript_34954/g.86989 Transcript_34954/m.86989 type:complete len:213 (-) Transcript_34954:680-1318(-)